MNCQEFKRLSLSDPKNQDENFVEHAHSCPECLKYVASVLEMDSKLADSLDVEMPAEMKAKLELNQLLDYEDSKANNLFSYAKVAGLATVMFLSGFLLSNQLSVDSQSDYHTAQTEVPEMADEMIVRLINHLNKEPVAPIWKSEQANFMMKNQLASYDPSIKLNNLPRLQFSQLCPLGENVRALHANLETNHGQITFAYIKGYPIAEVRDTSYKGQLTRIKPAREGSLVIISNNMYAMEEADDELEAALYWDI